MTDLLTPRSLLLCKNIISDQNVTRIQANLTFRMLSSMSIIIFYFWAGACLNPFAHTFREAACVVKTLLLSKFKMSLHSAFWEAAISSLICLHKYCTICRWKSILPTRETYRIHNGPHSRITRNTSVKTIVACFFENCIRENNLSNIGYVYSKRTATANCVFSLLKREFTHL